MVGTMTKIARQSSAFKVRQAARQYRAFTLFALLQDTGLGERSIDPILRRMIHDKEISCKTEHGGVTYFWLEGKRDAVEPRSKESG
jgi:hypothetical protein